MRACRSRGCACHSIRSLIILSGLVILGVLLCVIIGVVGVVVRPCPLVVLLIVGVLIVFLVVRVLVITFLALVLPGRVLVTAVVISRVGAIALWVVWLLHLRLRAVRAVGVFADVVVVGVLIKLAIDVLRALLEAGSGSSRSTVGRTAVVGRTVCSFAEGACETG